jgi:hypothetical protein
MRTLDFHNISPQNHIASFILKKIFILFMNRLSHYGDIFAIPLFILASIYFYKIEHKTPLEYILFLFSVVGALADLLFTAQFLQRKLR